MATVSSVIRNRNDELRHEILSYKPGNAVPCDDERVVFPDKLVISMICPHGHVPGIVPALRRALEGDARYSKLADKRRQTSTKNEEEYITDFISVITKYVTFSELRDYIQYLTGRVGCVVMLVDFSRTHSLFYQQWISLVKTITDRIPSCAMLTFGGSEDTNEAINKLKELGVIHIYEVPCSDHVSSDEEQLKLLILLHGCLQEGDRVLAINELTKICTNPRCRLLYEKTKKEMKEANQKMVKEVEERRHEIQELKWKLESTSNEHRMEQLERENGKLRTTIQLESEIRSAEQKRKAETPRWMQSLITWTNSGKLEQSVYSNVKLPNDEFAEILKQIADDLSDEAKIDSLGSQLGILQGDIARALKTNMRYEQVTSRGTHLMLKQWRRGVSREDERMELRRALVAAKLLDLADRYIPQGTGTGPGPGPGPGHSQKMEDSHQLSRIDSTSAAQCSSGGQTSVSSNEPFGEGTNTSDEEGVEDNGINYSDLLSNIALTETSSENLVMLLFIKVIIDVRQKAFKE
ncbi:uncharacterized protein LOC105440307 isoform X2 [Strongylocentrotus purpuratus]|uniref:Death domain-containing protein n=1 Tax=Strongylocentrotus purpuratus TaxID=7668 RepID=A0A7M7NAM0_STRPU|nr:uncharacterized protein LOC105440307 isoform X2 [Strongylocentrotus purpuratus]